MIPHSIVLFLALFLSLKSHGQDNYPVSTSVFVTGQVVRQEDYKTLFKANEFRTTYWLTKPAISENLIAIASHYDNALLLLNRANFFVIQRLEFGKASNGIPLTNTPQFHQNRLYQLDGDNTLHIFEQETNA